MDCVFRLRAPLLTILLSAGGLTTACVDDPVVAAPETACSDGVDDDDDGHTDCDDQDCEAATACTSPSTETQCDDGDDDDVDGLTDCADPDCDGDAACDPTKEVACDDGIDQDGDGATDCEDADCTGTTACCPPLPQLGPPDVAAISVAYAPNEPEAEFELDLLVNGCAYDGLTGMTWTGPAVVPVFVDSGSYRFTLQRTSGELIFDSSEFAAEAGSFYALLIYGDPDSLSERWVFDFAPASPPDEGTDRIRFINLAPKLPELDVWSWTALYDGEVDTQLFDGIPYGDSAQADVPDGAADYFSFTEDAERAFRGTDYLSLQCTEEGLHLYATFVLFGMGEEVPDMPGWFSCQKAPAQ